MIKKVLLATVLLGIVSASSNAARWELNYWHNETRSHYCALCFSKAEADDFKGKLNSISVGAGAIAGIVAASCPAVAALSGTIGGIIAGSSQLIKAVLDWNTSKGTGFSINIPSQMLFPAQFGRERGFMGLPLVPFIWESQG